MESEERFDPRSREGTRTEPRNNGVTLGVPDFNGLEGSFVEQHEQHCIEGAIAIDLWDAAAIIRGNGSPFDLEGLRPSLSSR